MLRTVVHRHTLADGSWHYDWMLEPPTKDGSSGWGADDRVLITFRVSVLPGDCVEKAFDAERIEAHRAAYLEIVSRELDGRRGRVERVAEGIWEPEEMSEAEIRLAMDFGGGWVSLEGRAVEDESEGRWRFVPRMG
ncbi:MAG: hypothetical protein AAGB34_01920 [Planctomycetota bacterium]